MNFSKLLLPVLCSLIFTLILSAAILRVFPACSLKLLDTFFSSCIKSQKSQLMLFNDNEIDFDLPRLMGRINDLEAELAGRSCAYDGFAPLNKDVSKLSALLEEKDLEGWKNKDLTTLSGCWTLTGSEQSFVKLSCTPNTDENCAKIKSSDATYCFNSEGKGTAKTKIDGNYCKAKIEAKFNDGMSLIFEELTSQICPQGTKSSDGSGVGSIIARNYTCNLTGDGKAECETNSSQSGAGRKIILVRLKNGQ